MIKKLFQKILIFHADSRGQALLYALILGFIGFTLVTGSVVSYSIAENRASNHKQNREQAFQIAEAGIAYYRWHLAHNKTDYQDGTGEEGTYEHEYEDKDGNVIGHYSLNITPPANGSTVVTIESTGWLDSQPQSRRTIRVRVGFPSLTDYAFLTNTDVWIGDTEATHGKFHANGGIRFDGTGDAPITSAVPSYTCKSHHGCGSGQVKNGIWGDGGPQTYWSYPLPAKDFTVVTVKLAGIKEQAQENGLYLSSSGKQGWRLEFRNDATVRASKVSATDCERGKDIGDNNYHWYCLDLKTTDEYESYPMPTNGYIFVEDTVWVDGTVNGRAVVGAKEDKPIIINGNILYLAKDGNHVLGLISEQDILIPHNSPDDLEIDAAILAQNGAAKRYYFPGDIKDSLLIYGSVITNGTWTWSWVSGGGSVVSGYRNTNSTYDANLTYGPPPGFPVGSEYNLISWEIVN